LQKDKSFLPGIIQEMILNTICGWQFNYKNNISIKKEDLPWE